MHELSITERILDIVLEHATRHQVSKVVRVHLTIGELSDLEGDWLQHYFDYLSRGTLAESAVLVITKAPIVLCCEDCDESFQVHREKIGEACCPTCGGSALRLVSGREYLVANMEVV